MEDLKVLDDEKFKEIYINEELRNAVAFAHSCCKSNGEFEYKKALMYPISYKVTEEQIKIAQELRNKRQKEVLKEERHTLLFVGMGMNFKPLIPDGVGNHRIRTDFLNADGERCFIELGTGKDDYLRIDHALKGYSDNSRENDNKYNYMQLESKTPSLRYTYANVLELVNKYFNCNFKRMVVDYYNVSCDGVICVSPKIEVN